MTMNLDEQIISAENDAALANMRLHELRRTKSDRDSRAFIAVNRITRDQVEFRDGDGKSWFGHIHAFIEYMKANGCTKRWADWNGTIYYTSDLFAGRIPDDMPGRTEHLPE